MAISDRSVLCVYRYDPLDRLADCAPAGQGSARFFYQKNRLATQIQGQIQHSLLRTDEHLLAHLSVENNQSDSALLVTDQQQSVIAAQGLPFAYTPYGHRHPSAGPMSLPGFTGQRLDPVTGHYLLGNGYRAFNPVLMRFNSPDSLSPFGEGGLNAYGYCEGDPVNRVDPSGHWPVFLKGILRGLGLMRKVSPNSQKTAESLKFIYLNNHRSLANNVNVYDRVKGGGKLELVVDAHGYDQSIHGGPRMLMGQQPVPPNKLDLTLRQQGVKFDNYESARLFMCNSAAGGNNSFAAEFSKATSLPVKAYRGEVIGNGPTEIRRYANRQYEPVFRLGIHKKNGFETGSNLYKIFSYDPVWFSHF
ncbi:RHS repeat-associated core domain-containing protein [Pseudomonas syringae]|uniref:RHS repeat-associated core domain-containing protein n=1 Tax=Pseudomonas syringae group TaxID=136849 RepID=UPI00089AB0BE|nr:MULTISPECIES: RHS repeat-associated core domain-containing protein [Pseudomonas syringae group]SDY61920.1 RHS repeat-associated core domain-containing protein [Pseudomonas syringae]